MKGVKVRRRDLFGELMEGVSAFLREHAGKTTAWSGLYKNAVGCRPTRGQYRRFAQTREGSVAAIERNHLHAASIVTASRRDVRRSHP